MGLFSRKRKTEDIPVTGNARGQLLTYQVACLQGIGRRAEQQDSFIAVNADDVVSIKNNGLLAVVADGMGGMAGGSLASQLVIKHFSEAFDRMDRNTDIAQQLKAAVYEANEAVYSALQGRGGSTVVACLFYDEKMYFASVGDSSIYLLRNRQLCRLNREQNSLNEEYMDTIRSGSMNPMYARNSRDHAALSYFVGMEYLGDTDCAVRPLSLMAGDVVLVCSDGVSGFMSENALHESLLSGTPRDICSRLEENIIRANISYQDNYTAVVVNCRY